MLIITLLPYQITNGRIASQISQSHPTYEVQYFWQYIHYVADSTYFLNSPTHSNLFLADRLYVHTVANAHFHANKCGVTNILCSV